MFHSKWLSSYIHHLICLLSSAQLRWHTSHLRGPGFDHSQLDGWDGARWVDKAFRGTVGKIAHIHLQGPGFDQSQLDGWWGKMGCHGLQNVEDISPPKSLVWLQVKHVTEATERGTVGKIVHHTYTITLMIMIMQTCYKFASTQVHRSKNDLKFKITVNELKVNLN
jgi:hypothetical protein